MNCTSLGDGVAAGADGVVADGADGVVAGGAAVMGVVVDVAPPVAGDEPGGCPTLEVAGRGGSEAAAGGASARGGGSGAGASTRVGGSDGGAGTGVSVVAVRSTTGSLFVSLNTNATTTIASAATETTPMSVRLRPRLSVPAAGWRASGGGVSGRNTVGAHDG
jgi:hypothetical protein